MSKIDDIDAMVRRVVYDVLSRRIDGPEPITEEHARKIVSMLGHNPDDFSKIEVRDGKIIATLKPRADTIKFTITAGRDEDA